MLDAEEIRLLELSLAGAMRVKLTVSSCRFSCCGRGFLPREGYEQTYVGRVAHIELRGAQPSSVRLNGAGIGGVGFILEAAAQDIDLVEIP